MLRSPGLVVASRRSAGMLAPRLGGEGEDALFSAFI
jgi:hypothetical protein